MSFSEQIKQYALSLGFDACGICKAERIDAEAENAYIQWLSKNGNADMDYLARNIEKRFDPRLLVENTKSIICVALNYFPHETLPENVPQFAYYAYGEDYHDVVKAKLNQLFDFIKQQFPETSGRYFCDSAPVLERYWAARAGIGFMGKNGLLIIPRKGSYFFLGELIIDIELDYDVPILQDCGNCRRCLDTCPTSAIKKPYFLDANKCISYQTIENKDKVTIPLHNNIYGCDICQKTCPFNRFAAPHYTKEFFPSETFLSLDFEKLKEMNEDTFRHIFQKSAVKRMKFEGLKRNRKFLILNS
ncbi:MAG: tRNA epoxyqueuosine(34) reductase QueG [Dysgonamonadaceae bacterium]|jgi:epoxyqueuosine reductase|nr:tRNA epoxyqueuosine(34) reductase QueG [Dysgonamonadaceae bacterium]